MPESSGRFREVMLQVSQQVPGILSSGEVRRPKFRVPGEVPEQLQCWPCAKFFPKLSSLLDTWLKSNGAVLLKPDGSGITQNCLQSVKSCCNQICSQKKSKTCDKCLGKKRAAGRPKCSVAPFAPKSKLI